MLGVGTVVFDIVIEFDAPLSPQALLQIAEYVPTPTEIVEPVAPVFHFTVPLQPVAVNIAVLFPQSVFVIVAITGTDGTVPTVIMISLDLALSPQVLIQTAE